MPVRRRQGSPYYQYDFTLQGRRFRGSCETADRATAQAVEAALRRDLLLNTLSGRKPRTTLDAAFARYWLEHAHNLANSKTIQGQATRLLAGLGKDQRLDDLNDGIIASYVARRRGQRDSRYKKSGPLVSPSSVNRELTLLRAVLRMAGRRWGFEVPAIDWSAHWLLEPAPRERTLRQDEVEKLLAECADHLRPAVEFSLLTGVRLANCITLDWSQVDMRAREIHFRLKSRRPGGKPHIVPMSQPCLVLLATLAPRERGPVFTREHRGKRVPLKTWKTAWRAALRRAGIEDFRWHDLRHTAASWMVQEDVPLDVVQAILGHESITTTQRYAHRETGARKAAVEALGRKYGARENHDGEKRKKNKAL